MKMLMQPKEIVNGIRKTGYLETFDEPLTANNYSVAEEALVVCKALLSKGKKIYKRMLDPLNEQRRVILDWRSSDLEVIQSRIEKLTQLLSDYHDERNMRQEEKATKALADAKDAAEKSKALQIAELESIASEIEAISNDHGEAIKQINLQIEELKESPAPIVAMLPDDLSDYTDDGSKLASRDIPTVEVVDLVLLAEAVAKHELPPEVVKPNLPTLNKIVRLNPSANIPGCRVVMKRSYRRKGASVQ